MHWAKTSGTLTVRYSRANSRAFLSIPYSCLPSCASPDRVQNPNSVLLAQLERNLGLDGFCRFVVQAVVDNLGGAHGRPVAPDLGPACVRQLHSHVAGRIEENLQVFQLLFAQSRPNLCQQTNI